MAGKKKWEVGEFTFRCPACGGSELLRERYRCPEYARVGKVIAEDEKWDSDYSVIGLSREYHPAFLPEGDATLPDVRFRCGSCGQPLVDSDGREIDADGAGGLIDWLRAHAGCSIANDPHPRRRKVS
jgi:predicted RNA-binding Zn-ribbon protein involved in translation (DUF1610 family)